MFKTARPVTPVRDYGFSTHVEDWKLYECISLRRQNFTNSKFISFCTMSAYQVSYWWAIESSWCTKPSGYLRESLED